MNSYGGWQIEDFQDDEIADWQKLVDAETSEGPTLQAKSEIQADDIAKWVTAFANGEGGVLLAGVKTRRTDGKGDVIVEVPGQKRFPLDKQRLQDIICRHIDPPPVSEHYHIASVEVDESGARAYAIFVPRSDGGPHQYDGAYLQPGPETATHMTDRQVRDAMGRGQKPEFDIEVGQAPHTEAGKQVGITVRMQLSNRGRGTARDVIVLLRAHRQLLINAKPSKPGFTNFAGGVSYASDARVLEWRVGVMPPQLTRHGSFIVRLPAEQQHYGSGKWVWEVYADAVAPQLFCAHVQINQGRIASMDIGLGEDSESDVDWAWT